MEGLVDAIQGELPRYNEDIDDVTALRKLAALRRKTPSFQSTGHAAGGYQGGDVYMVGNAGQGLIQGLGQVGLDAIGDYKDQQALANSNNLRDQLTASFNDSQSDQEREKALINLSAHGMENPTANALYKTRQAQDYETGATAQQQGFQSGERALDRTSRLEESRADNAARVQAASLAYSNQVERDEAGFGYDQQRDNARFQQANSVLDYKTEQAGNKPLPVGAMKISQKHIADIGLIDSTISKMDSLIKNIDSGNLKTDLLSKGVASFQENFGTPNANTLALSSFESTKQGLINNIIDSAVGVQTDSDALRKSIEIMQNTNDPQIVRQRLDEIRNEFSRNKTLKTQQLGDLHSQYGQEPPDLSSRGVTSPLITEFGGNKPLPAKEGFVRQTNKRTGEVRYIPRGG